MSTQRSPHAFPGVEARQQGDVVRKSLPGEIAMLPAQSLSEHFKRFREAGRRGYDAHRVPDAEKRQHDYERIASTAILNRAVTFHDYFNFYLQLICFITFKSCRGRGVQMVALGEFVIKNVITITINNEDLHQCCVALLNSKITVSLNVCMDCSIPTR